MTEGRVVYKAGSLAPNGGYQTVEMPLANARVIFTSPKGHTIGPVLTDHNGMYRVYLPNKGKGWTRHIEAGGFQAHTGEVS